MEESLPIFAVRIALDPRLTPRLPLAFYWRVAAFPSLEKLAEAAGVTPSHIVRILQGQRFPSFTVMSSLCLVLGYTEDEAVQIFGAYHRKIELSINHPTVASKTGRVELPEATGTQHG